MTTLVGVTSAPPTDAVLDAARIEFERHGMRRANMDAIARRAGVSRRTLYRRFPTKEALFEHLIEAESLGIFGQLAVAANGQDAQGAIVECFTLAMRLITESRLAGTSSRTNPNSSSASTRLLARRPLCEPARWWRPACGTAAPQCPMTRCWRCRKSLCDWLVPCSPTAPAYSISPIPWRYGGTHKPI